MSLLGGLLKLSDKLRDRARRRRGSADLALGRFGEDIAHRHLRGAGFLIAARNYKTPGGSAEVDLIAWEGETLVFLEVKTRQTDAFGAPERAIDHQKRRKIIYAAYDYLRRTCHVPRKVRFDVIAVLTEPRPAVIHMPGAWVVDEPVRQHSRAA